MSVRREMDESHEKMHGHLGAHGWGAPLCVTEIDVNARLSFTAVKAHEYSDQDDVLRAKVALLAGLVRKSRACMAFTGAGISTSAGIDDYATKSRDESVTAQDRPKVKDWKDARPTRAHRVMVAMYEAGMLKHWVQQNHDSLPQKAGFPQHALNEIHGSLHDPGNPIVPYEGTLRDDLFGWLDEWEHKNDLCLSLGTSLSGFNVDSVAETAAEHWRAGKSLGLVIVNLQQTPYDEQSALRIYAKIDTVMELLAEELGIADRVRPMDHVHQPDIPGEAVVGNDIFSVPFDDQGRPTQNKKTVWDLTEGRRVRLTGGPYSGDIGRIMGKSEAGHFRIRFEDSINPTFNVKRRPFSLWLGNWWLEEASKGHGLCPGVGIPFVNVMEDLTDCETVAPVKTSTAPVPSKRPANAPAPPPLPSRRMPQSFVSPQPSQGAVIRTAVASV